MIKAKERAALVMDRLPMGVFYLPAVEIHLIYCEILLAIQNTEEAVRQDEIYGPSE